MDNEETEHTMTETPEDIPQSNQLLYTIKLVTGEEILCTLVDERDTGVIIESPVQVKVLPVYTEEGFKNELSSSAWMPFASTRMFHIAYRNIVAINLIHSSSHKLYTKLVNRFEPTYQATDSDGASSSSFRVEPTSTIQ